REGRSPGRRPGRRGVGVLVPLRLRRVHTRTRRRRHRPRARVVHGLAAALGNEDAGLTTVDRAGSTVVHGVTDAGGDVFPVVRVRDRDRTRDLPTAVGHALLVDLDRVVEGRGTTDLVHDRLVDGLVDVPGVGTREGRRRGLADREVRADTDLDR